MAKIRVGLAEFQVCLNAAGVTPSLRVDGISGLATLRAIIECGAWTNGLREWPISWMPTTNQVLAGRS